HGMHAGAADRNVHGVLRGRLRGVLQLRALCARAGGRVVTPGRPDAPVSDREQRILGIIETARAKRAKFRDERITMAHGAGGKATQSLIEGLLVPALGTGEGSLEAMGDSGVVTIDGLGLALTTDSF